MSPYMPPLGLIHRRESRVSQKPTAAFHIVRVSFLNASHQVTESVNMTSHWRVNNIPASCRIGRGGGHRNTGTCAGSRETGCPVLLVSRGSRLMGPGGREGRWAEVTRTSDK